MSLARTLGSYSQLGETYIHQLQQLIVGNGLDHLHTVGLRPAIPQSYSRPVPASTGLAADYLSNARLISQ